jgi:two-component system sensor histidine kinase/response regulator
MRATLTGLLVATAAAGLAWATKLTGAYAAVFSHVFALGCGMSVAAAALLCRPKAAPHTVLPFDGETLDRIRLVGQRAGVRLFDWDLIAGKLTIDRGELSVYSDEALAALDQPIEFTRRIVHPGDLQHYTTELIRALKEKEEVTIEYRAVYRDGCARPVQLHGHIVRDANGRAARMYGLTLDMTSHVAAMRRIEEQALEQQRAIERLDLVTKAAGIGIWDLDLTTGQLCGDTSMARTWAQRDKHFPDLMDFLRQAVHPEDWPGFERVLRKALKDGSPLEYRYREIRPDGTVNHIQHYGKIFRDEHGKPVRCLTATVNVSALVRAQAELEAKSREQAELIERLNLATRVGGIGVWDWDVVADSITLDASIARAYDLPSFKVERDALAFCVGKVVPEDRPAFMAAITAALKDGDVVSHRHRTRLANGRTLHVQFHAQVFRNEAGEAVRLLGVTIDVTKEVEHSEQLQRRAEEERALRERLNLATETAGIGVWDMDLASHAIVCDQNTRKLFGRDIATGGELRAAIHPEDLHGVWTAVDAVIFDPTNVNDIVSARHRIVHPGGEIRHIQTHIRVFRSATGTPLRILGVTWDVTAEVEHAQQLEAQAAHVRSLLERLSVASQAAGISAWEFDLETRKFVWLENRTRALGLENVSPELFGEIIEQRMHPDDAAEFHRIRREAIASGQQTYSNRFRIVRTDGTVRHLQSYAHIMRDEAGRATRLLGATTDVTNEVQTTELLQRQAAQERALNDRLAIATEAVGLGTWEIDLVQKKFLWIENPIKELEYLLKPELSLAEYATYMHPDDRHVLVDNLRAASASNSTRLSFRYRVRAADGTYMHVQSHAYLVPDDTGALVRLLGASWNVTKDVETAERVEQQAQHERMLLARLSMATEAAGICSWEIDLETRRFRWTENWLKSLGNTRPEHSASTDAFIAARLHPDDRTLFENAIRETIRAKREFFSLRYRAIAEDGRIVHVQSHARLMRDEHGWARSLLGVSWDVTREVEDNQRLEEQARQQEVLLERLKLSSEAAGICSFEVDMERGVFLWSENPIRSLMTLDLRGMPIEVFADKVMIPEDRHIFRDTAKQALRERRKSFLFRYRGRGRDGDIVHVENHAHFVHDESGRAVRLLGVSWDVTNQVVAAEKLEQQSRQQRRLLERLSIATQVADISSWELDLKTPEFLWIENPIAALVYPGSEGYTLAELRARMHPEDRHLFEQKLRAAIAAGSDRMSYRHRGLTHDGRVVHIQNFVKIFFDEQRNPVSALGASWDVTKEIEAAEQLAQQAEQLRIAERRLERASLSSSEGHWESDVATRKVWLSSSYHTLLGYREGELPTDFDTLQTLFHEEDVGRHRQALKRHLDEGVPYVADVRIRCGNGEYRWFRHRGTAERDANGRPVTMSGSIHDIHEHKLAETALRLAQLRFERAINGTQDGLWELEANGTAWCSPRVGELLGYSNDEFPSNTNFLRDHLHPDDMEQVALATQAHFQSDQPYDVEIRLRTKSGDYRWYRARAKADRDAQGKPLRLSGSLQDVTEARAAREALVKATEAAEAANRAKSFFLANVSHEIRTPMNGIIGMTGLLLDTALDRTQRDYAETIRASADSLLIVINDILDFSKIEAGKLDIESIELDLRGNVEDVGAMMAFQAAAKNLELIVHVHPDVPDRVIGDPQRIRQCLINLVGNAIKFTREGEIVIEVGMIGRRDGQAIVHFQVRDTGIGIAADTMKTLFQPFVQADASTTRHFGGTGLGLSIVRRLVEMMGGAVGVESELGKGSTFWFTLPLQPAAGVPHSHPIELHRLGRRVLIVDDHETNRRVLAGQLMHAGYEVSLATTGQEALHLLRQGRADNHPYDIVIADYRMEDMDGATLGERINGDPSISNARIVILTSLDRHGDIRRFASLGFAGYLTKPIRARELFDCLDRVLAREAKEWHLQSQPIVTRATLVSDEAVRRYQGTVLLVEDNPVNQKVAVRFLERMGCHVRVADNGAEGVRAFQEGRFDLILMDLQMPVMDGLTATRHIRELEQGRAPTPIVALTANAMAGQLQRCLEVGMNGFLTKPLEIARLHETLELYGMAVPASDGSPAPAQIANTPVDLARLNEITDGDPEFAYELASTFIASGEQVLEEIQAALDDLDRNALSRAAHKLKGASANIHANALRELAYKLETQASNLDQPTLKGLVSDLREGFEAAAKFLKEQAPPPQDALRAS